MRLLYTLSITAYGAAIRIASLWNHKARLWVEGRASAKFIEIQPLASSPVWIHCASVGEFEQGRPLIEYLHEHYPEFPILLTFFSPSGYEMHKNYPLAAVVTYLPLDTPGRMRAFIEKFNPKLAIFVKYEVWHNCIAELKKASIPVFLISAKFRPGQHYFKPYGTWFAKSLKHYSHIYCQNEESRVLLQNLGINHSNLAGDTRFDRVLEIALRKEEIPPIANFKSDKKLLIAGSTWPNDEKLIADWWHSKKSLHPDWRLIIVPHEITPSHIGHLRKQFPDAATWTGAQFAESKVLLLDAMGMLSKMYQYADIAYIGGGFGAGIHNVLEAAVHGCPVMFGPRYRKFDEAIGLISCGAAFSVNEGTALSNKLEALVTRSELREKAGAAAKAFVKKGAGATAIIASGIKADLG